MKDDVFLAKLEACTLEPSAFGHSGHVRAAYLILTIEPSFGLALDRMTRAIKAYAASLDAHGKYHETITVASMAVINARMCENGPFKNWRAFAAANPDLLAGSRWLNRYYRGDALNCDLARTAFLLPGWAASDRPVAASSGLTAVE